MVTPSLCLKTDVPIGRVPLDARVNIASQSWRMESPNRTIHRRATLTSAGLMPPRLVLGAFRVGPPTLEAQVASQARQLCRQPPGAPISLRRSLRWFYETPSACFTAGAGRFAFGRLKAELRTARMRTRRLIRANFHRSSDGNPADENQSILRISISAYLIYEF
jgi:hypothetical protein